MSNKKLNAIKKKGLPINMIMYKHSLQLYKIYKGLQLNEDWMDLNMHQNFSDRNNTVNLQLCVQLSMYHLIVVQLVSPTNGQPLSTMIHFHRPTL